MEEGTRFYELFWYEIEKQKRKRIEEIKQINTMILECRLSVIV